MGQHAPLTLAEKEQIYRAKLRGCTLPALARDLGCSLSCVRKWWRCGRNGGLEGLQTVRRGRRTRGLLSQFAPTVASYALTYKRAHPGWGPKRVRLELQATPALAALALPSHSRLAVFFKQHCPEVVRPRRGARLPGVRPPQATIVHEIWQLDNQEGIRLQDQTVATICNIREPLGAAILASHVFEVTTAKRWRKLHFAELRTVLREAFAEWGTLPESIQTDNELALAGDARDRFPSRLTLWLCGLGIVHRFIRPGQPRDQPQIERTHRTLDGLAFSVATLQNCGTLQCALTQERQIHNTAFPSEASDCAGRPPLCAHPELLTPRRPYRIGAEVALFDLQRVYTLLATLNLERRADQVGQLMLGRVRYSIGRQHAGQVVHATCLVETAEWSFTDADGAEVARRPIKQLDVQSLTGFDPSAQGALETPIQLSLPLGFR